MRIDGACGTVYLLGTGSVQLVGSDYTACPFKTSAQGGSGADSVARAAIEAHAADADIHVTADEKAYWNTLSGKNDLDNPDFRVNQRGLSEYSTGYTVDRWYISTDKCKALDSGIRWNPPDCYSGADVKHPRILAEYRIPACSRKVHALAERFWRCPEYGPRASAL